MIVNMKTIEKLKKMTGNEKVKLAAFLGYNSSTAIDQWVKRNQVPHYQEARVILFLNEGKKNG